MRTPLVCLVLVSLLGCPGPAPAPAPTPSQPAPTPPPTPNELEAPTKGLGEPCGAGGTCSTGQTCARYYGIAGPSGQQFSSCEIPCSGGETCPDGTKCITIADGPGAVCRPNV